MAKGAAGDYVLLFMEKVISEKKNLGKRDAYLKGIKKSLGEKGFGLHLTGFDGWFEQINLVFGGSRGINSVDLVTLRLQVKLLAHVVFDSRLGSEPAGMLEKMRGMKEENILEGYQDIIEKLAGEVMEGREVMKQYLPKFLIACFEVLRETDANYFVGLRSALPYPK